MAPETTRSASGYEEQLRRHELAAGRALLQVLPEGEPPSARQLAEARRALTRALRDLRGLKRELELDLRRLHGGDRQAPGRAGSGGRTPAAPGQQPARTRAGRGQAGPQRAPGGGSRTAGRRPEELYRYEAAGNAIDEVLDRWEARRAQLASEIERRSARRR